MMDIPENYYAVLGVPVDADTDTLKRAYRQLARRFHPDLAGTNPNAATEMKRINRAYAVLNDPEKRQSYDAVIGGVLDFRNGTRPRPQPHTFNSAEDMAFDGLSIFSTKGPFRAGPVIRSALGVISALGSVPSVNGPLLAAGSLDGKGKLWRLANDIPGTPVAFDADPALTIESLRELRFSSAGSLLGGWGRLALHVWDAFSGERLWSHSLLQRAVSAHYSLDMTLSVEHAGTRMVRMALPLWGEDPSLPRSLGVRGTDVVTHIIGTPPTSLVDLARCAEENIEKRQFWAIRHRALSRDAQTLVTLSCAQVPDEVQEMAIIRRWDLRGRTRQGTPRPHIAASVLVGRCADCTPPYVSTPDASTIAFVYAGQKLRICDTNTGTYSELLSGSMGSSSKLALSPDAQYVALAREDSEINEGVVDLWSIATGQIVQKFYHPWQISALHFADKQLYVALTDGTIQTWR
ncbi:MAG: hypothetical protein PVS3B3_29570 [Ktedonobacteraceae bacterium]